MAFEKHGPVPVPFDSSYIRRYFDKFKTRAEEDEDEDEVDDVDEDDSESEDEDDEKSEDEKEKGNKVVLGDEKEPIGTVKRPPQEAPIEGEAICKVPRAVPPQVFEDWPLFQPFGPA
uniref:Uncharacterized protein n=1 Tax=Leersia perrieri TaxID=77586 RepID=A0A0D9WHH9_9ORYZ